MASTIEVKCPGGPITITWHAVIDDANAGAADVAWIKLTVEQMWNPSFPLVLKYGHCTVKLVADVRLASDVQPPDPTKYDTIKFDSKFTTTNGQTDGPSDPDSHHEITVSRNSMSIGHEVGHALGLEDSVVKGQKEFWDAKGITRDLVKQILWSGKGWDKAALCCNPGFDYFTDHEVSVTIHKDKGALTVEATSLEHKIERIVVRDRDGNAFPGGDGAPAKETDANDVKDFKGREVKGGKQHRAWSKAFATKGVKFPICVEVHEAGDANEPADVHIHGWFDESGAPVPSKGHALDDDALKRSKAYYPALHEGPAPKEAPKFEPPA